MGSELNASLTNIRSQVVCQIVSDIDSVAIKELVILIADGINCLCVYDLTGICDIIWSVCC